MNGRRCPECGNELQRQAVFCTTCGRDLASLLDTRRHRTLLFGTPVSLVILGIMLAWDIGWESPLESGADLGMILALVYIGGAVGLWLAAATSGRAPDMISAWRGGVYAVSLLPVTVLIGMTLEQAILGNGHPGITLADEPYLMLGIEFCIFIAFYIAGVVGGVSRLSRTEMPPIGFLPAAADGGERSPGRQVPSGSADEGLAALIGYGNGVGASSRSPGMARLLGLALCLAALGLAILPASSRLVVQARIAVLLGRHERALAWTRDALARSPQDASAHHLHGLLLLARGRDADEKAAGLEHLRKAVRAEPRAARYHLALGMELNGLGLASEAVQAASEAVKRHPGEYRLWMLLADILTSQDRRNEAVDAYRKAVDLEPQDPVLLNNLAFTLLELDREPAFALELAKKSVDLQPGYVFNLDTLAWALHKNGRSNEALEVMFRIRESVATPSAEIEFHNAVICREMNLLDAPRAVFERIAARPDANAVPGLKRQIEAVLATLPAQAEAAAGQASSTAAPAGAEGR
ncbi:MAG TPA: hypothetical protein PLU72_03965 [Candidatus Ozemobacteraceae bacterium]|mgnify:CR=1 FL=1|nr:hypothetical protein [Candidatus Ozemobacteraceae bacterium]